MKHTLTTITLILLFAGFALCAGKPQTQPQTQTAPSSNMTDKQKTSYSIGINIGMNLYEQQVDIDSASLLKGIQDGLANSKPALSEAEIRATLMALQKQIVDRQEAQKKALAEKNKTEADKFLAENKAKPGVVTLPSGLQYKIITAGKGPKPAASDTIKANYKGTFLDGKQFDSSYDRGEPASFQVNAVIPAWTEALQLMPVGSKWQLFVPPSLAYGENGFQNVIPPNAALMFEVELLSIEPPGKADADKHP